MMLALSVTAEWPLHGMSSGNDARTREDLRIDN